MRRTPSGFSAAFRRSLVGLVGALVAAGGGSARAQITADELIRNTVPDGPHRRAIDEAIDRFEARDVDGCRDLLARARSDAPKLPPPGVMMATLWLSVGELGPARAELEDTLERFPDDPEAYIVLGDLAYGDQRLADAAVMFDKATELTETFTKNPRRRRDFEIRCAAANAAVAEARQRWDTARRHLETWIDIDPDNPVAHQRMGAVLYHVGREQAAIAAFRKAKGLDGAAEQPELAMARLCEEAGHADKASRFVEAALEAAPDDEAVLLASAWWYLARDDAKTAGDLGRRALEIDPKGLEALGLMGTIARASRDYKAAEKFFRQAHRAVPDNFAASNALALVLLELGDDASRRKAAELAEANVAAHGGDSPQRGAALGTQAWVYYRTGRRREAETILEELSRENMLTMDGAYYLAQVLADRGDRSRAGTILDDLLGGGQMFDSRPAAQDLQKSLAGGDLPSPVESPTPKPRVRKVIVLP